MSENARTQIKSTLSLYDTLLCYTYSHRRNDNLFGKITYEEALAAVRQDGWALEHVPSNLKTTELCLEAVRQDGWALELVPSNLKTAELCLETVKLDGLALLYVPDNLVTAELCLIAVKQNGEAFAYVPEPLRNEVRAALKNGDRS